MPGRSLIAAGTLALVTAPVLAAPVSTKDTQEITIAGQAFSFSFPSLAQSDGAGGQFHFFARGDYTDPGNETVAVTLDVLAGTLTLSENGVVVNTIPGLTLSSNNTVPDPGGGTDQILDFLFDISATALNSILADGSITANVQNSPSVSDGTTSPDERVELGVSYNSTLAVPVPATLTLLGLGLGLGFTPLGWSRRKKQRDPA